MSQRAAVSRASAARYRAAGRPEKARILDELCAVTGWHRDHARKALRTALVAPRVMRPARARPPLYGEDVIGPLRKVWAVLDAPAGKRLAPFLPQIVASLERAGELDLTADVRRRLVGLSAATIDRRLAGDRKKLALRGRSGTKPGSLLKSQIPVRTWADWKTDEPGFVEIDLVGHEGGDARGDFAQTLTVTDILTGWTETRAVRNKAQKWVFAALLEITAAFPFPIKGIDSDNGSEFINNQLLRYCDTNKITFTRSRPGRQNDGAHVEQKNWSVVRHAVGYHRYDTPCSGYRSTSSRRPRPTTSPPPRTSACWPTTTSPQKIKDGLDAQYLELNPAQLRRDQLDHADRLLDLVKAARHQTQPRVPAPAPPRASADEATTRRRRAS